MLLSGKTQHTAASLIKTQKRGSKKTSAPPAQKWRGSKKTFEPPENRTRLYKKHLGQNAGKKNTTAKNTKKIKVSEKTKRRRRHPRENPNKSHPSPTPSHSYNRRWNVVWYSMNPCVYPGQSSLISGATSHFLKMRGQLSLGEHLAPLYIVACTAHRGN